MSIKMIVAPGSDGGVHGAAHRTPVREVGQGIGVHQPAETLLGLEQFPIGVLELLLPSVGDDCDTCQCQHQFGCASKKEEYVR